MERKGNWGLSLQPVLTQSWLSPFSSLCGPSLAMGCGGQGRRQTSALDPIGWSQEPRLGGREG